MDRVPITRAAGIGRGRGFAALGLLVVLGVLLMHGVTDRWDPFSFAEPEAPSSSDVTPSIGHHDIERCVPCGVVGSLTLALLVTAFVARSPITPRVRFTSRVMGLDLSPPDVTDLCVFLR